MRIPLRFYPRKRLRSLDFGLSEPIKPQT